MSENCSGDFLTHTVYTHSSRVMINPPLTVLKMRSTWFEIWIDRYWLL